MLDDKDEKFAYEFLRDRETYHNQKENAANAVFLLETGLFGALIGASSKPQINEFVSTSGIAFSLMVAFVWCLLHVFMRFQLRNRRVAALQIGTLINALIDNLSKESPQGDMPSNSRSTCRFNLLDYFVPWPKSAVDTDIELERFPDWYRTRFLTLQSKGTGARFAEIFPTYASIAMLIFAQSYVLCIA